MPAPRPGVLLWLTSGAGALPAHCARVREARECPGGQTSDARPVIPWLCRVSHLFCDPGMGLTSSLATNHTRNTNMLGPALGRNAEPAKQKTASRHGHAPTGLSTWGVGGAGGGVERDAGRLAPVGQPTGGRIALRAKVRKRGRHIRRAGRPPPVHQLRMHVKMAGHCSAVLLHQQGLLHWRLILKDIQQLGRSKPCC